mmetsp:Transcript_822/g.2550  ORF Transcript_822/g.2550 Transcript_822/m.2550 type:complete len:212 (-) Transcript_822:490-1125(-)
MAAPGPQAKRLLPSQQASRSRPLLSACLRRSSKCRSPAPSSWTAAQAPPPGPSTRAPQPRWRGARPSPATMPGGGGAPPEPPPTWHQACHCRPQVDSPMLAAGRFAGPPGGGTAVPAPCTVLQMPVGVAGSGVDHRPHSRATPQDSSPWWLMMAAAKLGRIQPRQANVGWAPLLLAAQRAASRHRRRPGTAPAPATASWDRCTWQPAKLSP